MDMDADALGEPLADLLHCRLAQRVAVKREEQVAVVFEGWLRAAEAEVARQILVRLLAKANVAPLAKLSVRDAQHLPLQIEAVERQVDQLPLHMPVSHSLCSNT